MPSPRGPGHVGHGRQATLSVPTVCDDLDARCAEKGISSMAAVYLTLCVLFLVLLVAEQDQFARRSHGPQCLRSAFRRWLRV